MKHCIGIMARENGSLLGTVDHYGSVIFHIDGRWSMDTIHRKAFELAARRNNKGDKVIGYVIHCYEHCSGYSGNKPEVIHRLVNN